MTTTAAENETFNISTQMQTYTTHSKEVLPHIFNNNKKKEKKLYLKSDNFTPDCIFFLEAVKNKIIQGGTFIRVIYSTSFFTINLIHYIFDCTIFKTDQFYNKYILRFNSNQPCINKIKEMEKQILARYAQTMDDSYVKIAKYKINEFVNFGNLKVFSTDWSEGAMQPYIHDTQKKIELCLKIIGIWETSTEYGLIYKLFPNFE